MAATDIVIDEEFAILIPPLSEDEKRELEASIIEHGGAREPLIVWDRGSTDPPILLDGHNRLSICSRRGLPYETNGLTFASRDEAKKWMQRNQLGRRNLNRNAFMLMLGKLYHQSAALGRNPRKAGRKTDALASEHAVAEKTVRRAGKFRAAAEKLGIVEDIASGRIKATVDSVIAVAASLPANPTQDQIAAAIRGGLSRVSVNSGDKWRGRPDEPVWLASAEPTDCLKAIRFYAASFVMQAPESVAALNNTLIAIVQENRSRVA